ncbi:hypothetical protein ABPG72_022223 [Tetrahymena utriculariae]
MEYQVHNSLIKRQFNQILPKLNDQNFYVQQGKGFSIQAQGQTNGMNMVQKNNVINFQKQMEQKKQHFQKIYNKNNQLALKVQKPQPEKSLQTDIDKKIKKLEELQKQQLYLQIYNQQSLQKLKSIYQQLNHLHAQKLINRVETNFEIQQKEITTAAAPANSDDQLSNQNSTQQEGDLIKKDNLLLDQADEKKEEQVKNQQEQKHQTEIKTQNESKDRAAAEEIKQSDTKEQQNEQQSKQQDKKQSFLDKLKKCVNFKLMQKNVKENDYDYLFFIDYECNQSYLGSEIIEFPIQVVDVKQCKIIDTFTSYVQPSSKITQIIKKLTKIDDSKVENAPKIQQVLQQVQSFLDKYLKNNFDRCAVVYDNESDFLFIVEESVKKNFLLPAILQKYIDLGTCFPIRNDQNKNKSRVCLQRMLDALAMKFEGQKHCGADDCKNQALVAIELLKRGYCFTKDLQVNNLEQVITNYFMKNEKKLARQIRKLNNSILLAYKKYQN